MRPIKGTITDPAATRRLDRPHAEQRDRTNKEAVAWVNGYEAARQNAAELRSMERPSTAPNADRIAALESRLESVAALLHFVNGDLGNTPDRIAQLERTVEDLAEATAVGVEDLRARVVEMEQAAENLRGEVVVCYRLIRETEQRLPFKPFRAS